MNISKNAKRDFYTFIIISKAPLNYFGRKTYVCLYIIQNILVGTLRLILISIAIIPGGITTGADDIKLTGILPHIVSPLF